MLSGFSWLDYRCIVSLRYLNHSPLYLPTPTRQEIKLLSVFNFLTANLSYELKPGGYFRGLRASFRVDVQKKILSLISHLQLNVAIIKSL